MNADLEWKNKTTLTGYHFYNELNPDRCNADSMNATSLVNFSKATGRGILAFHALHIPDNDSLSSLPAKSASFI